MLIELPECEFERCFVLLFWNWYIPWSLMGELINNISSHFKNGLPG